MTCRPFPWRVSTFVLCIGLATLFVAGVSLADNHKRFHKFVLRYVDAKDAQTQLQAELEGTNRKDVRLHAGADNSLMVLGSQEEVDFVQQTLWRINRKAEQVFQSSILDQDPKNMTDAQLREFVAALAESIKEMAVRIERLEEGQKPRVVPLK